MNAKKIVQICFTGFLGLLNVLTVTGQNSSVQYVSHPDNTWSLLREKQNGKYEKAVVSAPNGNEWFHARIVIQYPNVTVYVDGNPEPSLSIEKLNTRLTGKIGLFVGNGSDGDFTKIRKHALHNSA